MTFSASPALGRPLSAAALYASCLIEIHLVVLWLLLRATAIDERLHVVEGVLSSPAVLTVRTPDSLMTICWPAAVLERVFSCFLQLFFFTLTGLVAGRRRLW